MRAIAKQKIEDAINMGYSYFISGMAIGFDMICAEIVLELKLKYPHIKLECALPCQNQHSKWNKKEKERHQNILKHADKIRCIFQTYSQECMHERNKYMINNSSLVIALYDDMPGGTKKTLEYAKLKGRTIEIISTKGKS